MILIYTLVFCLIIYSYKYIKVQSDYIKHLRLIGEKHNIVVKRFKESLCFISSFLVDPKYESTDQKLQFNFGMGLVYINVLESVDSVTNWSAILFYTVTFSYCWTYYGFKFFDLCTKNILNLCFTVIIYKIINDDTAFAASNLNFTYCFIICDICQQTYLILLQTIYDNKINIYQKILIKIFAFIMSYTMVIYLIPINYIPFCMLIQAALSSVISSTLLIMFHLLADGLLYKGPVNPFVLKIRDKALELGLILCFIGFINMPIYIDFMHGNLSRHNYNSHFYYFSSICS